MARLGRPPKYRAVPTIVDGIRFASKKEAAFYNTLKSLKMAGEIKYFLLQVPIPLPGKTKYVCDFQVFYANGKVEYFDVKGMQTEVFKLKKRQVEEIYPIEITII